jgi:hypothetical protein
MAATYSRRLQLRPPSPPRRMLGHLGSLQWPDLTPWARDESVGHPSAHYEPFSRLTIVWPKHPWPFTIDLAAGLRLSRGGWLEGRG